MDKGSFERLPIRKNYQWKLSIHVLKCCWYNYKKKIVFCKKILLSECNSDQLPISSSKLDFPVIKNIGKTLTQCKKKCLSNVLITGKSNFDERNGQLVIVAFGKK